MGEVSEKRTLFFPSDGSILDVIKLNVSHDNKQRIVVRKNRMTFGIKDTPISTGNQDKFS